MTTKTSVAATVQLDDLAGQLHVTVAVAAQWVEKVGGTIEQDWAGRSIVTPSTARKALDASRAAAAENARLQSEYDNYRRQRQQQVHAVGEEAFQRAGTAELKRERQGLRDSGTIWVGLPETLSPVGRAVAQQAADEARAKFERANPFLPLEQWAAKGRKR